MVEEIGTTYNRFKRLINPNDDKVYFYCEGDRHDGSIRFVRYRNTGHYSPFKGFHERTHNIDVDPVNKTIVYQNANSSTWKSVDLTEDQFDEIFKVINNMTRDEHKL